MRLENRVRRLEESGKNDRKVWSICLPGTSVDELRRITEELRPEDMVFLFDLREQEEKESSDTEIDDLVASIVNKKKTENAE